MNQYDYGVPIGTPVGGVQVGAVESKPVMIEPFCFCRREQGVKACPSRSHAGIWFCTANPGLQIGP